VLETLPRNVLGEEEVWSGTSRLENVLKVRSLYTVYISLLPTSWHCPGFTRLTSWEFLHFVLALVRATILPTFFAGYMLQAFFSKTLAL